MLPPVFVTLKASVDVRAIVGNSPARIYRMGRAPQETEKPYITWFLLAGTPENQLSGTPPVDRMTVQVDCWHPDDKGCERMAETVRNAIEPFAHLISMPINERETETKLFRIALEFDWFHDRPT